MSSDIAIPKIIHQTWKTSEVPAEWQAYQASWQGFHPDWQYMLWTDEDNRRLIAEQYPDFISTYDNYSYNIQRADAIRYFILHHFGGLYVDLDFECLRPMDSRILNKPFVVAHEPKVHAERHGEARMVGNAFMASIPGSLPLVRIIETMKTRNPRIITHQEVLSSTGPKMVTAAIKDMDGNDIRILDEHVFCPYTTNSPEMADLVNERTNCHDLKKQCLNQGTYGIHYWHNTWVRNLAGPLINPTPHDVKGYLFYPGQDSGGFDIKNAGRNIQVLVDECNADKNAVGFNTDGFIKSHLIPRLIWSDIDNKTGNQGLYIKKHWQVQTKLMLYSLLYLFKKVFKALKV
jgi:hypothetical protein